MAVCHEALFFLLQPNMAMAASGVGVATERRDNALAFEVLVIVHPRKESSMSYRLGPWGRVKTWWEGVDEPTLSDSMPYLWCQIDLIILGEGFWRTFQTNQLRATRAIIVDVHPWPEEDLVAQ